MRVMAGFEGSFAVVVGGSRGIGADVAQALHDSGARVVTLSRTPPTTSRPWEQAQVDATSKDEVARFFEQWRARFVERNLLLNFAGIRYNVPLADSDPDAWWGCVESSLLSTFLMTRGF